MKPRKIIHIDADCFYASIELRDNPRLIGKPVAVGGAAARRGVISTCNYEARSWGVHSAMSTSRALSLCPELIVLPTRMEVYREASQQMQQIYAQYTDLIEPLSLDEAFLDVSEAEHCQGSATWIAEAIRQQIWAELNITVSAGIAPNKFLAKIASDWRKPNGLFVITPDEVDQFVLSLPVNKLHGVGKVTADKLSALGITTCAILRETDRLLLHKHFGRFGERLWQLAHGIDQRPVQADVRRQTVSVEETFTYDLPDLAACLAELPSLLEQLQRRLQRLAAHNYRPDKPFVKIKFNDFSQTTLEQVGLPLSLNSYQNLLEKAYERGNKAVRLLGVGVRLVDLNRMSQLELFEQNRACYQQLNLKH